MNKKQENYIGLMSGTSMDGIDAVVVNFDHPTPQLLASLSYPLPALLRKKLAEFQHANADEINRMGECDIWLGHCFAEAATTVLKKSGLHSHDIIAIGSHGQTIRHRPDAPYRFTLQIGDPNTIAYQTTITTVADFRRRDMAASGQGAPLTPAFHQALFRDPHKNRVVLNIGGIANITFLCQNQTTTGFDTGPGNGLLDLWIEKNLHKPYDDKGQWAASGTVDKKLLARFLEDPYFTLPAPKSTGRDYFNANWLEKKLQSFTLKPQDIQATLLELTAASIINAIHEIITEGDILVCGGGVHNAALMKRLQQLTALHITSTENYGVHPDWVEAIAFAWFAKQTLERKTSNLPAVTGALKPVILGGIYY